MYFFFTHPLSIKEVIIAAVPCKYERKIWREKKRARGKTQNKKVKIQRKKNRTSILVMQASFRVLTQEVASGTYLVLETKFKKNHVEGRKKIKTE